MSGKKIHIIVDDPRDPDAELTSSERERMLRWYKELFLRYPFASVVPGHRVCCL